MDPVRPIQTFRVLSDPFSKDQWGRLAGCRVACRTNGQSRINLPAEHPQNLKSLSQWYLSNNKSIESTPLRRRSS